MHETYNIKRTKVGSGPIFRAAILFEPIMHSVLLSDATDEADLAKEVFLGAMVVDEQVPKEGRGERVLTSTCKHYFPPPLP